MRVIVAAADYFNLLSCKKFFKYKKIFPMLRLKPFEYMPGKKERERYFFMRKEIGCKSFIAVFINM